MCQKEKLLAHVREEEPQKWIIHDLEDHLKGVAEIAKKFAAKFSCNDWLEAAALLHDMGKGSEAFQNKIKLKSGYDPEGHIKDGEGQSPHSTHGAVWAYHEWGPHIGKVLAYLIAGHHGGLPDWTHTMGIGGNLEYRLKFDEVARLPELSDELIAELTNPLKVPDSIPELISKAEYEHFHLWIRILYSCLVDADFLDTERFMDFEKFENRGKHSSMTVLKKLFDAHMDCLTEKASKTPVNTIRSDILIQCRLQADKEHGLFSLTVPTGGGKTLSSMAFALEHAVKHNKERIIMVIPYTSIIEQTSKIYKEIFHDENVIEHHSSLDPDKETPQSRLASENWDAPIIVTTSVQFFESLFAAKSSACRKLHNIVNSVVIIDEVQMLPTDYLKPVLHCIKGLTRHFNVSMVLCTATQPAITSEIFQKENGEYYAILEKENCCEIMTSPTPQELTEQLQRVQVEQLGKFSEWCCLAEELKKCNQVLCIVNTRNDCRELYEQMPENTIHLSANMCGQHRSVCIEKIKKKLDANEPVHVISTQLVEAGVDFDFPVVFRAMAGFDSIAQAAGRCNREGRLKNNGKPVHGKVFVFDPPTPAPVGALRKGEQAGKTILSIDPEGCRKLSPQTFTQYFEHYFSNLYSFDKQDMEALLVKDAPDFNFQFRTAAQKFNLIDNQRQVSVVVWYEKEKVQKMINELRYTGPYRNLMRRLQRYTVSIPENVFDEVRSSFEDVQGIWCQNADTLYDSELGFVGYTGDVPII
ncbi:MAG: CRISPR-associated helicase Cas3' [Desulfotignum sp.]|nr:CRISPR-associated helicase Cas3' [Desulfotignum sp.]